MSSSILFDSDSDDDVTFTKEITGLKTTGLDDSLIEISEEIFISDEIYDPSFVNIDSNQRAFVTDQRWH